MIRLLAYLLRFAVIALGLVCAWASASAFLHLLMFGGAMLETGGAGDVMTGGEVLSILIGTLVIGRLSFWPALLAALAAEFLARRDWLFFALAGAAVALVALAVPGLAGAYAGADRPEVIAAVVATGLVAGIAYWAVAGRSAGLSPRGRDDTTAPGRSGS